MKIKHLQLNSLAGFNKLVVDFSDNQIVLIVGTTAVEKAKLLELVLDLLLLLVQAWQKPLQLDLTTQETVRRVSNKVAVEIGSQQVTLLTEKNQIEPETYSPKIEDFQIFLHQSEVQEQTPSQLSLPMVAYYSASNTVTAIPPRLPQQKRLDSFFEWYQSRCILENEELIINHNYCDRQLQAIRAAIATLMTDLSELQLKQPRQQMSVTKQNTELLFNQLSPAENRWLVIAGDLANRLATANPDLSDPLTGSGVVLIDEIELHLHPQWQRRIIPALTKTFPNCQFILTTYSPLIVSHVNSNCVYVLKQTPDGITAEHPESSFGRDSNRILEDVMGVPARPLQFKEALLELFRSIDAGNLEQAKKLSCQLATEIGADEPELVRADTLIRRKGIVG